MRDRAVVKRIVAAITNERALSLVVAFDLAFAQPTLDLLGRNAEFFVAHDSSPLQMIGVVLLLSVGLPLLLALCVRLAGAIHPVAGNSLHLGLLATLIAVAVLHVLGRTLGEVPATALMIASLVAAVGVTYLFATSSAFRSSLRLGALVPVALIVWFVFVSPAGRLLRPVEISITPLATSDTPPIVMLIFDELPLTTLMDEEGGIDENLFPNFARLARSSTWFRNATTVAIMTSRAVPSLLTGRYAGPRQLPTYSDHPANVFTLLRDSYRFIDAEPITQLCPPSACQTVTTGSSSLVGDIALVAAHATFPAELTEGLPPVDQGWAGFAPQRGGGDPDRALEFARFVSSIQPRAEPTFYLGHFLLPHLPWSFLPSGQTYPADFDPPGQVDLAHRVGRGWADDPWLVKQGYQRHILQTRFLDGLIGDLLDRLEATGLYDEAIVIVTSDHGAAFRPGLARRAERPPAHRETVHVPLFIKLPGSSGGEINDAPVESVDVIPTIMAAIGARTEGFDGRPAYEIALDERHSRRLMIEGRTRWHDSDWTDALAVARAKYRKLGDGDDPFNIWHLVPPGTAQLLGRKVAAAPIERGENTTALLDDPDAYEDVDPSGPTLPALLGGLLRFSDSPRSPAVVVALNGRIVAVTRASGTESARRFYAMIPPASFVPGRNTLRLFTVDHETSALLEVLIED